MLFLHLLMLFRFIYSQLPPSLQQRILILNSFFHQRLASSDDASGKTGFNLVRSWTRDATLFDRDFVIVPINESLHWYVAIICHPSRMLIQYDPVDEKEVHFSLS